MSILDSGFFFKKNSLFYQLLELSSFPSELSMNCWFRALFDQFNLKKEVTNCTYPWQTKSSSNQSVLKQMSNDDYIINYITSGYSFLSNYL